MNNLTKGELLTAFFKWIGQFPDDTVFHRVDIEWEILPNPGDKRGRKEIT